MGKILYIAGLGHNGSTVLDIALGFSDGVSSLSQLNDVYLLFVDGEERLAAEPGIVYFWEGIARTLSPEEFCALERLNRGVMKERALPRMLLSKTFRQRYARANERVIDEVFRKLGGVMIVDSSKNLARCLGLQALEDHEIYVLHLIRDFRGYIESHNKRRSEAGQRPAVIRPYVRWLVKNCFASLVLPLFCERMVQIKFEDIQDDPEGSISQVEELVGIPLDGSRDVLMSTEPVVRPESVTFAGNRVLAQRTFLFRRRRDAGVQEFDYRRANRLTMDRLSSRLFWYTLGWVSSFWGYRRGGSDSE